MTKGRDETRHKALYFAHFSTILQQVHEAHVFEATIQKKISLTQKKKKRIISSLIR